MGIETKEDRFTDFIKTLFENDKEFKKALLNKLVEKSEQKLTNAIIKSIKQDWKS